MREGKGIEKERNNGTLTAGKTGFKDYGRGWGDLEKEGKAREDN